MDSETRHYVEYYRKKQRGGNVADAPTVYRGARRWGSTQQVGGSDPMRNIIGFVGPALAHGTATFLSDTAAGYAKGQTVSDAVKNAIGPAIMSTVRAIGRRSQGGEGRKRKRRRVTTHSRGEGKTRKRRRRVSTQQRGEGKSRKRRVYKRRSRARPKKQSRKRSGSKIGTLNF